MTKPLSRSSPDTTPLATAVDDQYNTAMMQTPIPIRIYAAYTAMQISLNVASTTPCPFPMAHPHAALRHTTRFPLHHSPPPGAVGWLFWRRPENDQHSGPLPNPAARPGAASWQGRPARGGVHAAQQ